MNIRQCRGMDESRKSTIPHIVPVSQDPFLAVGMLVPAPDRHGLGPAKECPAMPSETAWKARYARLWKATAKPDAPYRALSHQRVMVALEAYRQLALPGLPGPTALGRVADVAMETAGHVLAELKAASQ